MTRGPPSTPVPRADVAPPALDVNPIPYCSMIQPGEAATALAPPAGLGRADRPAASPARELIPAVPAGP
jgi:hypothetical protein